MLLQLHKNNVKNILTVSTAYIHTCGNKLRSLYMYIYIVCNLHLKKMQFVLFHCALITVHISNKHFCYKLVYVAPMRTPYI